MPDYPDKSTMIEAVIKDGLIYGEGVCAMCLKIWEAAVEPGCDKELLECPRCHLMAGVFTTLRKP